MARDRVVRSTYSRTRGAAVASGIHFRDAPAANARPPGDDPREMAIHEGGHRAGSVSLDREAVAPRARIEIRAIAWR